MVVDREIFAVRAEFHQLLKDYKCVKKYMTNLKEYNNRKKKTMTMLRYLTSVDPANYISKAFEWKKTDEKSKFWSSLHNVWINRLEVNGYV